MSIATARPRRAARFWALAAIAGAVMITGCETDDLGKACGADAPPLPLPSESVYGETPVVEVVRIQRDSVCESFQCLTHRGLAPYCTRPCEANRDCPSGFVCGQVQETGPLADKRYCVFEEGCERNIDCGDLGRVRCAKLGCVDECEVEPLGCEFHQLRCYERNDLGCECKPDEFGNLQETCTDADLICTPTSLGASLPDGSVAQLNVCMPQEQ